MFNYLNEGCLEQIDDKCLICQEGWIQDEFLEHCYPICGDGIIQGQEQCDHGNLISNHSCYLCQYSCIQFCLICQFGICLQCQHGFVFSQNRQNCIFVCDGIIQEIETCQNQNNIQFNVSNKFQQNCDLRCQLCINQICFLCDIGWELRDNQCYSFCGDGLIALHSIEQCDDGNQIENDGCFGCQLECITNCLSCLDNEVCFMCQENFQLEGQLCLPICGDGIIISGFEDCDDGNIEPNDGCYQCKFECSQGCLNCKNEQVCKECNSSYILNNQTAICQEIKQLDYQNQGLNENPNEFEDTLNIVCSKNFILIDNECVNQCGNGMLNNKYEQCDDGNLIGGDGCSFFCIEEDTFKCQNHQDSMSICSFIKPPDFMLYRLSSQKNQTQTIELRFTQKVKLLADLSFEEIAVINLIPQSHEIINIKPIVKLSTTFDNPIYQIFVEFLEPVKDPVLQINFNQLIIKNEHDLDLMRNQMQINFDYLKKSDINCTSQ
ncbi:unnamed protein product [Paramecium pentaurelia]|uniref:Uncharacterized protein n=1 Tax=Paramecium pentaurelia TaxID=43138 RepID=A0A8S1X0L5_9CILI|nr:unnamed protein product [Paramecium pentaurelia]